MMNELHWLIFGAGAIGTYIGGSLALSGQRVIFLERSEIAQEIRSRGMRLSINCQARLIKQPILAASLAEALESGPFDVAIFALKSYDTSLALESIAPHATDLPPFLCLQNGVENEATLAATLGAEKVIAGTVTSAIGRRAAGDIILERRRGLGVAAGHPLSESITFALAASGVNAHLFPSAPAMKWSKMLTNLLANATSAILDMTPAEVFAHSGLYRLEIAQLREALAVMRAHHIPIVDLPGVSVRMLAAAVRFLPLWVSRPLLQRSVGSGRGGKMPSFHIDLHHGHGKSEVNYLNGAVVRYGAQMSIPTPVNRLLNETLSALVRGEIPLGRFARHPEQLLQI
jgi:2-dehydropantoate 2-reductase